MGLRYIAHINATPSSDVVEIKMGERTIEKCKEFIRTFFKVKDIAVLSKVLISTVIDNDTHLVYSSVGTEAAIAAAARADTGGMQSFRVIWFKTGSARAISTDLEAENYTEAIKGAILLKGITSIDSIKYAIVFTIEDIEGAPSTSLSNIKLSKAGEFGTRPSRIAPREASYNKNKYKDTKVVKKYPAMEEKAASPVTYKVVKGL